MTPSVAMICLFILFQFAAPQISLPFLQVVKPILVITAILTASVLVALQSGSLNIHDPRTKYVLFFWILMGLHIPVAFNNFAAYGLTMVMFPYIVAVVAIATYITNMKQLMVVTHLWIGVHVYQALYAITHGGMGIGAYFEDDNDLAVSLIMAMPVAYFLFLGATGAKRILYAAGLVVLAAGLVAGFSRGGFIGMIATVAYCLWKSPKRFAGLLTAVAVFAALLLIAQPAYWDEMETITKGTENRTAEHRVYMWTAAWRMFLDNFLWGVGPGSSAFAISAYEPPRGFDGTLQAGRPLHSTQFTLLCELAIPGIIIFVLIFYRHFQSILAVSLENQGLGSASLTPLAGKQESRTETVLLRHLALGFGGGLVGFFVGGVFVSMLYYPQFWIFTGFMIALHQVWRQECEKGSQVDIANQASLLRLEPSTLNTQ